MYCRKRNSATGLLVILLCRIVNGKQIKVKYILFNRKRGSLKVAPDTKLSEYAKLNDFEDEVRKYYMAFLKKGTVFILHYIYTATRFRIVNWKLAASR